VGLITSPSHQPEGTTTVSRWFLEDRQPNLIQLGFSIWQEIEIDPMAEDRVPILQQYPGHRRREVMSYCAEGFWTTEIARSIHA
jgi:hypothetical protein